MPGTKSRSEYDCRCRGTNISNRLVVVVFVMHPRPLPAPSRQVAEGSVAPGDIVFCQLSTGHLKPRADNQRWGTRSKWNGMTATARIQADHPSGRSANCARSVPARSFTSYTSALRKAKCWSSSAQYRSKSIRSCETLSGRDVTYWAVQELAHCLYHLEAGTAPHRVQHFRCALRGAERGCAVTRNLGRQSLPSLLWRSGFCGELLSVCARAKRRQVLNQLVCSQVTFLSKEDLTKFRDGPEKVPNPCLPTKAPRFTRS
eukprot:2251016-Rhodomonas_salina.5